MCSPLCAFAVKLHKTKHSFWGGVVFGPRVLDFPELLGVGGCVAKCLQSIECCFRTCVPAFSLSVTRSWSRQCGGGCSPSLCVCAVEGGDPPRRTSAVQCVGVPRFDQHRVLAVTVVRLWSL